jgi:hypothetical protein
MTTASGSFKEFKQVQFSGTGIIPSIPELSTWAMMLTGFAGLGSVGHRASRRGSAVIRMNWTRREHGPASPFPGAFTV